jgi:hypothetical protein
LTYGGGPQSSSRAERALALAASAVGPAGQQQLLRGSASAPRQKASSAAAVGEDR